MTSSRLRFVSYMVPGFPVSLFEHIAAVVDADLELDMTRSGPAPGDDPFADGRADLGWICSTSFVDLATRSAQPSVRLAGVAWVPDDPGVGGEPRYFGDLVVPDDSPVRSLADLEGQAIGCNDEVSLSGHYALRIALNDLGVDPDRFANLEFTGGHRVSLDRVVEGRLDAAVVDSVVRTSRSAVDPEVAGLRIVERLGPWPVQPLVANSNLPQHEVDRIRDALLASNDDPVMQAELGAASLVGFVPVGLDHYLPIREALQQVGGP